MPPLKKKERNISLAVFVRAHLIVGVLFCMSMQVSFLSPPFGPAAFYQKSVAPPGITLGIILRALVPFIMLQILPVALLVAFPGITGRKLPKAPNARVVLTGGQTWHENVAGDVGPCDPDRGSSRPPVASCHHGRAPQNRSTIGRPLSCPFRVPAQLQVCHHREDGGPLARTWCERYRSKLLADGSIPFN